MTYFKNDPRSLALADGTVATLSNDAAPQAFTPTKAGSGTITFRVANGVQYWACNATSTTTDVARLDYTLNTPHVGAEFLVDLGTTLPSSDQRIVQPFNSGQTGGGMGISWLTTGQFRISSASGVTLLTTAAGTAYTGKVRFFIGVEIGTTTTDGEMHVKFYTTNPDTSTTPDIVYDSSTDNLGTSNFTAIRFGKISSNTGTTAPLNFNIFYFHGDDGQYTNAGLGPLPTPPAAPPTINVGSSQINIEPYSFVTLTYSGTVSRGTMDYTTTQTAGTAVTLTGNYPGSSVSYVAPGTIAGETETFSVFGTGLLVSASDSFTAADTSAWNSSIWTKETAISGATVDILSNAGRQITPSGANKGAAAYASGVQALSDCDVVVDISMSSTLVEQYAFVAIRGDGTNNTADLGRPGHGYGLVLQYNATSTANSGFTIEKYNGTTFSTVVSYQKFTLAGGATYRIRLRAVGGTIYVRIWGAGSIEPGVWTYVYTDSSPYTTAGHPRLAIANGADGVSRSGSFDNFSYSTLANSTASPVNVTVLPVTERAVVGGVEVPMRTLSVVNGVIG